MNIQATILLALILRAGDRVILIGDSEAYLLSHEFPALAKASGVSFKAIVRPGSSVISWSRSPDWGKVRGARPDVLLVSLGANDACMGARVVANEGTYLRAFLVNARATGARELVWLGPPAIGSGSILPQAKAGLDAFARMVREAGVRYLDARTINVGMWPDLLHCSRPQWYGDKAHGCATWAEWIWHELQCP